LRLLFLSLLVILNTAHSQVIEDKLKDLESICSQQLAQDDKDSANLVKAILKIKSSQECSDKIGKVGILQNTLTRGGRPCPVNIEVTTGVGDNLSGIGAGLLGIHDSSGNKIADLDWSNDHIKKVSVQKHMTRIGNQLKSKGICSLKSQTIEDSTDKKPSGVNCMKDELTIKSIGNSVQAEDGDYKVSDFKFSYKNGAKECVITVKDDDGVPALAFTLLSMKKNAKNSSSVEVNANDLSVIREALDVRHKMYKDMLFDEMSDDSDQFEKEHKFLREKLGPLLDNSGKSIKQEDFDDILSFVGSTLGKHVYTRENSCGSTATKKLQGLIFGSLSLNDSEEYWDVKDSKSCDVIIKDDRNKSYGTSTRGSSQVERQ